MSTQQAFITGPYVTEHKLEMTLRDYFAAKSFQVRLAKHDDWTLTELAEQAYLDADVMMKARTA